MSKDSPLPSGGGTGFRAVPGRDRGREGPEAAAFVTGGMLSGCGFNPVYDRKQ